MLADRSRELSPTEVTAATKRLLDILDLDRNGKVDAREIIEMIQHHEDAEECINLLRSHPNPETALNIQPTLKRIPTALSGVKAELDYMKSSLTAHQNRKSTTVADTGTNDPKPLARKTSRLMRALDMDHNGHIDAHELIQMIREHSEEASETLRLIKEHPDPANALGCAPPRQYRRKSHLMATLLEAKMKLKQTRHNVKRMSTLKTEEEEQILRRKLTAFSESMQHGAEDGSDDDDDDDGEQVNTYQDSDVLVPVTASNKVSKVELALREHTRKVREMVCSKVGTTISAQNSGNSSSSSSSSEDNRDSGPSLSSLLNPNNHVFMGLCRRTPRTTFAALPLCLSGAAGIRTGGGLRSGGGGRSGRSEATNTVGLSSFDTSCGVVWRFIRQFDSDESPEDVVHVLDSNTKNGNNPTNFDGFDAYLECTDHQMYLYGQDREEVGQTKRRFFLARDLTLVNFISEAARWHVRICPAGNFRNGPKDVAVTLALLPTFVGEVSNTNEELYLCVEGKSGQVCLIKGCYMDDFDNGLYIYDNAWEATMDADGPTNEAERTMMSSGGDFLDFPSFESYLES